MSLKVKTRRTRSSLLMGARLVVLLRRVPAGLVAPGDGEASAAWEAGGGAQHDPADRSAEPERSESVFESMGELVVQRGS
jgi:hypothetical protein